MKKIRRRKNLSTESIYRFIRRCMRELTICENNKAYLAGIILIGTSIEYMLNAWIRTYPDILYARKKKLKDYTNLSSLNKLAYESDLMNRSEYLASERIRKFRNMVHPNWYAGRKPPRFTMTLLDERISDFNKVVGSFQSFI